MNPLYSHLKSTIGFGSKEIDQAFAEVDRADFVFPEYARLAYQDNPLPIGHNATISQPTTVAFMLNQLDPRPGETILDVGSGSGWTAAILAKIVGKQGHLLGTEIVPELAEFGSNNLKKYNLKNADIILAGDELGFIQQGPFDRILVSAAAERLPLELVRQLKIGGRMVIPVGSSLFQIDKKTEDEFDEIEFPGFMFVPLQ